MDLEFDENGMIQLGLELGVLHKIRDLHNGLGVVVHNLMTFKTILYAKGDPETILDACSVEERGYIEQYRNMGYYLVACAYKEVDQ